MGPDAWKQALGSSAWEYLTERHNPDAVAEILTRASEAGWVAPTLKPSIIQGRKVLWPTAQNGVTVQLTARGWGEYWRAKGHGWLLLRVPELMYAVAGPLLPRLQEILGAYEEVCTADSLPVVPEGVPTWFVGGVESGCDPADLARIFADASPTPTPPTKVVVPR